MNQNTRNILGPSCLPLLEIQGVRSFSYTELQDQVRGLWTFRDGMPQLSRHQKMQSVVLGHFRVHRQVYPCVVPKSDIYCLQDLSKLLGKHWEMAVFL